MRAWIATAILSFSVAFAAQANAIETIAKEAYIIDYDTGSVLMDKAGEERMPPSSMSKLMTAYVVFKHLKEGSVKLDDQFTVSEKAWRTGGSKMFIHVGDLVKLEDLMRGMIIQSGNDACIAIAEGIAGSEEAFAAEMNKVAAEIGLTGSHFMNATGLPDDNHYMTPRDLASLARHIIHDFPEFYHYDSEIEFTYNGIKQGNRNPLLYNNTLGVDGLKTGHTDKGGYGVTVSGKNARDGRRIIVVVNGLSSMKERATESRALLTYAYMNFENLTVAKADQTLDEIPVWMGKATKVPVAVKDSLIYTVPRGGLGKVTAVVRAKGPIEAPVAKGTEVASLHLEIEGQEPKDIPLYATADVEGLSGMERLMPNISALIFGHKKTQ